MLFAEKGYYAGPPTPAVQDPTWKVDWPLRLPAEVKKRYDLSSLRWITHGAAPCAPAVKREMIDWWGPVINEYYGATETGIVVWHNSAEALKPGTVGRLVKGAIMHIVDEQGRDVKQGEVGEIYLRGPLLSDFTYNNDDAKRREIALGDLVTVGDVGYQDPDGYLFLCDRKRDMIIAGGVNIYPAEIESVLIQMPGVRDCAVFGIPDEEASLRTGKAPARGWSGATAAQIGNSLR
jgi:long-chain acyl-CoA synthetase